MSSVLTLKKHQIIGQMTLMKNKKFILADDMGVGKTIQALKAAAGSLSYKGKIIISCPDSVKSVWLREIEKWKLTSLKPKVISGSRLQKCYDLMNDNYNVFIITSESIATVEEVIKQLNVSVLIVDEAHKLKNRETLMNKSTTSIVDHFPFANVFLLTGTPLLNTPEELFSLLHLIDETNHPNLNRWLETNFRQEWVPNLLGSYSYKFTKPRNEEAFKEKMSKYMLRRLKSDVLDLPERTFVTIECELVGKQLEHYKSARDLALLVLQQEDQQKAIGIPNILAQITRLKQVLISPTLIDLLSNEDGTPEGCKLYELANIVEDSGDQKIVVFSQFSKAIHQYHHYFSKLGYKCEKITGDDRKTRDEAERNFQEGDSKIIFVSMKAGGLGLTLTAGSICVMLDDYWNPAINLQAMDRLYRMGQNNAVTVYSLIVRNSIEDKIRKVLSRKQGLIDTSIPGHTLEGEINYDIEADDIWALNNWETLFED